MSNSAVNSAIYLFIYYLLAALGIEFRASQFATQVLLTLEPFPQPFFVLGIFKIGS
jgi:hypothetical protein